WIQHLLDVGPTAISIHGRTLKQGYRGDSNWGKIAEAVGIARGSATLILGNGDLSSLNDVVLRVHQTGVDGVLIGRASMGNPWIFHRKEMARGILKHIDSSGWKKESHFIEEKTIGPQFRFSVALQHARLFEAMNGKQFFKGMRKHLGYYIRGFDGARALRAKMVCANNADEVSQMINTFLSEKRANKFHEPIDRSEKDAQLTT
ncbi:tRNA-dihydrouridine synthase, partial [Nitrospira defluvii]|nr:tRNA-dihydrouridine synthase [Nitrospira defluvii]